MHVHVFAVGWTAAFLCTDVSLKLGKKWYLSFVYSSIQGVRKLGNPRLKLDEICLYCPHGNITLCEFSKESLCEYSSLLSFLLAKF